MTLKIDDKKAFSSLIRNFADDNISIEELDDLMCESFNQEFIEDSTVLDIYLTLQHFDVFYQERKSNRAFDTAAKENLKKIANAFEINLPNEVEFLLKEFSTLQR